MSLFSGINDNDMIILIFYTAQLELNFTITA